MHFLGACRDGLVARPVEMDKLSSSVIQKPISYPHGWMLKNTYRLSPKLSLTNNVLRPILRRMVLRDLRVKHIDYML
jgi:hypothetical protein